MLASFVYMHMLCLKCKNGEIKTQLEENMNVFDETNITQTFFWQIKENKQTNKKMPLGDSAHYGSLQYC